MERRGLNCEVRERRRRYSMRHLKLLSTRNGADALQSFGLKYPTHCNAGTSINCLLLAMQKSQRGVETEELNCMVLQEYGSSGSYLIKGREWESGASQ